MHDKINLCLLRNRVYEHAQTILAVCYGQHYSITTPGAAIPLDRRPVCGNSSQSKGNGYEKSDLLGTGQSLIPWKPTNGHVPGFG